jgi:hypothetical protein
VLSALFDNQGHPRAAVIGVPGLRKKIRKIFGKRLDAGFFDCVRSILEWRTAIEVTQTMAWEFRNGKEYYYRTRRTARGGFERIYFGCDEVAHLAAAEDALRQAQRESERAAWLDLTNRLQIVDQALQDLGKAVGLITTAALRQGGYYQHDRGEWRRRGYPRRCPG